MRVNSFEEISHIGSSNDEKSERVKSKWMSWILFIVILVGVFFTFRFVIGVTVISGNSMYNTIENNDVILTSHLFYKPERNDIIIYQDEHGFDVIKRIIALPNETIEISGGLVYVNGLPIDENFVYGTPNDMEKVTVKENTYFVMGDNRTPGESLDSRSIGTIDKEQIKGEVLLSLFPLHLIK